MTLEQRIIQMLGERDMQIAQLVTQLDTARERITDLEQKPTAVKSNGKEEHVPL
jgi:hypothetical protein